jgi:AcrR family transcriptional regulator
MSNKEQILQTALRLFAQQGYDRTPTSQIAREAAVSEGLIFRHYGNKACLLEAIIQLGLEQIAGTMAAYQTEMPPKQAIIAHIESAFALMREHETFWRLVQKVRFQDAVRNIAGQQMEAVYQFIVGHLTESFQKMGAPAPEQEALMLFALIDGITLHYLDDTRRYPLDKMQTFLTNKYSDGYFLD